MSEPMIPDEAVYAAEQAHRLATETRGGAMYCALAAAYPHIERQVRGQIADELAAQPRRYRTGPMGSIDPYLEGWDDGMDHAEQLARGRPDHPVNAHPRKPGEDTHELGVDDA